MSLRIDSAMNEHRSVVPLFIHRFLLGFLLFIEGFHADFIHHEICAVCRCHGGANVVDCSGRKFTRIPPLPGEIKQLRMDGNCLNSGLDDYTTFRNCSGLTLVSFRNCCLSRVSFGLFRGMFSLEKIDLSYNTLRHIVGPDEVKLLSVKEIILDSNLLEHIPSELFVSNTPNVEVISLRHNGLVGLLWSLADEFKLLSHLRRLDLGGNPLGRISADSFENIPRSVRTLRIDDCLITDISAEAFERIGQYIFELDLSANHLSLNQLKGLFSRYPLENELRVLRLSRMALEEIPPDPIWKNMVRLETLDFSENQIEDFSFIAFRGLNLKNLYLDDNRIKHMLDVINITDGLSNLESLSVRKNRIETLPSLDLRRLKSIHLGENLIQVLGERFLQTMPNMKFVNLTKNYIREIHPDAFSGVEVTTLDIASNNITNWRWFDNLRGVVHLNISNNSLPYLSSNFFQRLGPSLLVVDLSYNGIDDLDPISFSHLSAVRKLRLDGNGFGRILYNESMRHLFTVLAPLESLSLGNMGLSSIPKGQFDNLTELRELFLHNNNITHVCDTSSVYLGDTLQVFDLGSNNIREIDTDYLKNLGSLKIVNFAHNPFHCSCSVETFQRWVNESNIEIVDFDGTTYKCYSPESVKGVFIRTFKPAKDCSNSVAFHFSVQTACIIATCFGVFLILAISGYHFRHCSHCRKPRYAYVGENEFKWSGRKRVLYIIHVCQRILSLCPNRTKSFIKSEPASEVL